MQEDLPKYLEEITPNSTDFIFKGNAGKGNYSECPSVAILNKEITKGVGSGFFVIYIFSKDTKRLYLSLNQAILGAEDDLKIRLKQKADKFREKLDKIPKNFNIKTLSLGKPNFYSRYEFANICAKEYTLDNLPNDNELVYDLNEIINLYKKLANSIPKIWQISPGSIKTGEQNKLWPLFKQEGFIGIGWLHDSRSYLEFENIDKLKEALIEFYSKYKETILAKQRIWCGILVIP